MKDLPETRAEAKRLGAPRYFTGKPCVNGHTAERRAADGNCLSCAADRERQRRRRLGDELLEKNRQRWSQNKDRYRPAKQMWREENKERLAVKKQAHYRENVSAIRARAKERRSQNSEQIAAKKREYAKSNPWIITGIAARRRARKLQATPKWADAGKIKSIYQEAARLGKHVDHIIPLAGKIVCGLHVEYNLQLLDAGENISKGNRFDADAYLHGQGLI